MPPPLWGAFIQNILSTYAQTEVERGLDDEFAAEGSEAGCASHHPEKWPRKMAQKNEGEKWPRKMRVKNGPEK